MPCEAYVDLRHLNRIADEIDGLSSCVVRVAIDELEYKRVNIKEARVLLKEMLEAWDYFSEYDVPIGMKESIEKLLLKI
ncbi:hypothetical protein [Robertmurraya sp.]|uniref:hypothetical protein n=1 Tax=Robertmurraya sp. TaxID=2837525 RepID=UPI0037044788